jgi:hypothetical protein
LAAGTGSTGPKYAVEEVEQPWESTAALSFEATMSIHAVGTAIARSSNVATKSLGTSNAFPYLLHHFTQNSYKTLANPATQKVIQGEVPGLLMTHPFLMHAVLAFSASHLGYLQNNDAAPSANETGVYHTRRALALYGGRIRWYQTRGPNEQPTYQLYAQRIEGKAQILPENVAGEMDALLVTSVLLTSLFFHNGNEAHMTSWILPETSLGRPSLQDWHRKAVDAQFAGLEETLCPFGDANCPFKEALTPLTIPNTSNEASAFCDSSGFDSPRTQTDWISAITGMATLLILGPFARNLAQSIWKPFFASTVAEHLIDESVADRYTSQAPPASDSSTVQMNDWKLLKLSGAADLPLTPLSQSDASQTACPVRDAPALDPSATPFCYQKSFVELWPTTPAPSFKSTTLRTQPEQPSSTTPLPTKTIQLPHLVRLAAQSAFSSTYRPVIPHLLSLLTTTSSFGFPQSSDSDSMHYFSPLISFPSRLPPLVLMLVRAQDEVAMLVLGYWFTMLERLPHWWCRKRGQMEAAMTEAWLCRRVKEDAAQASGWGARVEEPWEKDWRGNVKCAVQEFVGWREQQGGTG